MNILVNYTPPQESVDLSFEDLYGTELEFLDIYSEKFSTEKYDGNQFLNNGCRHMSKKSLKKMRQGRREQK